jgi:4-aminobutyrate aminotransferase-like enzyme
VHGFTWSHNALGAAVGRAVLRRLSEGGLIDRSAELGERLRKDLAVALEGCPIVGDVRGIGMMVGVELVRDRETADPFPRTEQVTERITAAAREAVCCSTRARPRRWDERRPDHAGAAVLPDGRRRLGPG